MPVVGSLLGLPGRTVGPSVGLELGRAVGAAVVGAELGGLVGALVVGLELGASEG